MLIKLFIYFYLEITMPPLLKWYPKQFMSPLKMAGEASFAKIVNKAIAC